MRTAPRVPARNQWSDRRTEVWLLLPITGDLGLGQGTDLQTVIPIHENAEVAGKILEDDRIGRSHLKNRNAQSVPFDG